MVDENVEEKTENTPEDKTKENEEEKAPENVEDNQSTEVEEPEIDYKAELEKAKAIISHKEDVIKAEKAKRQEAEDIDYEEPEDMGEKIKEAVESQIDGFKKSFVSDAIDDEIDKVSISPDEAELIKFHFENSVKLSGTTRKEIREAVEYAKLLANKKKIMSNNRELAEALRAKATTRTTVDSAGERIKNSDDEVLDAASKAFIAKYEDKAKKIHQNAPANNT